MSYDVVPATRGGGQSEGERGHPATAWGISVLHVNQHLWPACACAGGIPRQEEDKIPQQI